MTLKKKILGGYGIALSLIGAVLAWAVVNLVDLGRASEAILRENYKSILAADQMMAALERQDSAILLSWLDPAAESTQKHPPYENQFLFWLGRAKDNITIEGEDEIVDEIEKGYLAFRLALSQLETRRGSDRAPVLGFYDTDVYPVFEKVRAACLRLKEINQNTMYQASQQAQAVTRWAIGSTLVIGVVAMGLGLVFSLLLTRRLVEPLRRIIETAQRIGEGHYDVHVPADSTDELGRLADEFNAMAHRLHEYHELNVDQLVAEQRKSEAILRSIEDGLIVVDAELRVININGAAIRQLGREAAPMVMRPLEEIITDERLLERVRQVAETGETPAVDGEDDILAVGKEEENRYLMFSVTPVHARSEGLVGVVVLLRDVTRLKEVDRLKSQFVMTASHELRTPLTSLGMSIELLREKALERLDERQQQLLLAASEEVQRLEALVGDLLDLSKIEAGRIELEFSRVPVRMLFEKVLSIFRAQTEKQQIQLTADAADLPDARADANKITWVLTNLVSNALRYVQAGGHIQLSAWRLGALLYIAVRDDGAGIPTEYQTKIFDKFVQLEGRRDEGGSGLGLAICKELVRAHGGAIWVESTPGRGSTFTFTLPVCV